MTGPALHGFDRMIWQLSRVLSGTQPGAHRAALRGAGDRFADAAPFMAHPDPRRLDLRRSATDPFGGLFVRRFETRTALTLHFLLDASASLAAGASSDRQGLAGLLAAGFARAAWRGRDRVALTAVGGDEVLADVPASRRRSLAEEIAGTVAALDPRGGGVAGLIRAAQALPAQRVLVVVLSDFDHSADELRRLLRALQPRPVLPLWLRDSALEAPSGALGLAETRDPETGRRRTVLTTRRWAARQTEAARRHRAALRNVFAEHGTRAVEISDAIDLAELAAALDEAPL